MLAICSLYSQGPQMELSLFPPLSLPLPPSLTPSFPGSPFLPLSYFLADLPLDRQMVTPSLLALKHQNSVNPTLCHWLSNYLEFVTAV